VYERERWIDLFRAGENRMTRPSPLLFVLPSIISREGNGPAKPIELLKNKKIFGPSIFNTQIVRTIGLNQLWNINGPLNSIWHIVPS
jgi:hypothetical protein